MKNLNYLIVLNRKPEIYTKPKNKDSLYIFL